MILNTFFKAKIFVKITHKLSDYSLHSSAKDFRLYKRYRIQNFMPLLGENKQFINWGYSLFNEENNIFFFLEVSAVILIGGYFATPCLD